MSVTVSRPAGPRSTGLAAILGAVLALAVAACSTSSGPSGSPGAEPTAAGPSAAPESTLTVYSGRSEELVGDLFAQFEEASGIDVQVRYGDTAELAATILEEGDNSPADVFFGQDAGALGALQAAGRLAPLPQATLDRVDAAYRSTEGVWVGTSGRARVLAYNTDRVQEADLPTSVFDLTDPAWKGRIGWVPTNGSFQSFITAMRQLAGEERTREWLEGMLANEPRVYEGNGAAVEAVASGEVDAALVNHYYILEAQEEAGESLPLANHFFANGDPGSLVNVAGAGIVQGADHPNAALAFVDYLLSEAGQQYFAEAEWEYPLAAGVEPDARLIPLDEIPRPEIDLADLADLEGTLRLLQEVGVI